MKMEDYWPGPLTDNAVHVWHLTIHNTVQDMLKYSDCLSPPEINRSRKFNFEKDRLAYLARHVFLRKVLACYLDIDCGQIHFRNNAYGKPFIDINENTNHINFNLSKSHDHVLLAVTRNRSIGCDIEKHDKALDIRAIAGNFFSAEDIKHILESDNRHRKFFDYWSAKEAYIKAQGKGLSIPLNQFTLLMGMNGDIEILENNASTDNSGDWRIKQLNIRHGFSTAIAVAGKINAVSVVDVAL